MNHRGWYDSYLTDGWEDSPIPAIVESLIMLTAAIAAVFVVDRVLASIEWRRAQEKEDTPSANGETTKLIAR